MRLLRTLEEHLAAFEYDWRARFHTPLRGVFSGEISWREAWNLVTELLRDPSSHAAAAVGEWDFPASRESLILADLYDLQHQSKSKRKPKPYPRPFKDSEKKRYGKTTLTPSEAMRVLAERSPMRAA